jgi:lipopolysaccharide transport system ATP-binding protein
MPPAIRVQNLGKRYRVNHAGSRPAYGTLRERLTGLASTALRRRCATPPQEEFWALEGVDFEVDPGEVVGVIGRNGAGKSTLLKILSRITRPTTGRVEMRGRVGSLLEIGTGFHPELTGRENVYLNGSILGLSRREIASRFDEIVAFAEIDRFLDTPVKRYSSGMYVRLAFGVAAHLDSEILIVDEVLAVGDASFQRKCLGKIRDVASGGRTVFFVSHQIESVRRLCTTAVWLDGGRVVDCGCKDDVIEGYLAEGAGATPAGTRIDLSDAVRSGNGAARFAAIELRSGHQTTGNQPYPDGPLEVSLVVQSDARRTVSSLAVTFYDRFGTKLVNADSLEIGESVSLRAGRNEIGLRIDGLHLKPGNYGLGLWMAHGDEVLDRIESATIVEVVEPVVEGFGRRAACDGTVTCDFRLG